MSGPIKPKEVQDKKLASIPEEVYEAFNELIVDNWDGKSASVSQKSASVLVARALDITEQDVYLRHLLDVEDVYRKAGWKVVYDKPGYNEDYEAFFVFSKSGK